MYIPLAPIICETLEPTDDVEIDATEGGVVCCKLFEDIDELLLRDMSNDDDDDTDDCEGGDNEL